MDQKNVVLFEEMPVSKAANQLIFPTVMGSLVMIIYSLSDTFFVGMLSDPVQNAAVTLVSPVMLAFNAVNNLFGVGSSSMMSRALGKEDYDTVKKSSAFGIYGALMSGVLISILCVILHQPLLDALGTEPMTRQATAEYMKWTVIWGAAPSIMNVVMAYLVRSEGAAFHASIGTMCGCLLNIILDPLFILPFGLNMGAAGAGLATCLSNCVACAYFVVLLVVKKKKTYISLHPRDFCMEKKIVMGICGVGVPAAVQNILNVVGMTILNNITAAYGASAVAAMGIAHKIYFVPVQISMGATQGVMPLISYTYTAKLTERMKNVILYVIKLMVPCMAVIGVICWIGSSGLIRFFNDETGITMYGTMFLKAFSIAMPFQVLDFTVVGVLQALGKGKKSLLFAILRKAGFEIPAVIILNMLFGASGLGYGALVAEIMLSIFGVIELSHILREEKRGDTVSRPIL